MCRFKSGIIFKTRCVVAPGENDSHSDLLNDLQIEDSYTGLVRSGSGQIRRGVPAGRKSMVG